MPGLGLQKEFSTAPTSYLGRMDEETGIKIFPFSWVKRFLKQKKVQLTML